MLSKFIDNNNNNNNNNNNGFKLAFQLNDNLSIDNSIFSGS